MMGVRALFNICLARPVEMLFQGCHGGYATFVYHSVDGDQKLIQSPSHGHWRRHYRRPRAWLLLGLKYT